MLDLLQWPAFAVTVAAGWLVASDARDRRLSGFITFLVSNVLWTVWAWHTGAWALVALQVALVVPNVRGVLDNRRAQPPAASSEPEPEQWSTRPDGDYAALVREGLTRERTVDPPKPQRVEPRAA